MDLLIPAKKSVVLDATMLASIMGCARLTDFQHNYNFRPITGKGNSLEAGSLVHKILETYHYCLIHGMPRKDSIISAMSAGENYYQHGSEQDEAPTNIPLDNEKASDGKVKYIGYNHIIATMVEYFDFYKNDSWTPVETEQVTGKVIYEDDDLRLLWKAKLDTLFDTYHGIIPVDHKTMKQRREVSSLNNQFMGQCVVADTRTMIINKIGFQSSLKSNEKFERKIMSYTSDRLKEWVGIAAYYARVYANYNEDGYWPPNFTHCDKFAGCIFRSVCECDRNMREEELKLHFVVGPKWDVNNDQD